ncbi:MAG: response regulator [Proteobacteria bacterium]|nr:response regulator [Pseudomonadota bacterium]
MSNAEILIVEDEAFIALGLQKKLETFGYFVSDVVHSGEKAIERVIELQPDLVLMDIVLEGEMDGIEAAKKIWDQFRIPIIYISAYGDDKNLNRAKQTEPVGYLLKPYSDRDLQITIELSLYKSSMQKKIHEQQHWYSTILKSLGEAVITVGLDHSIMFINPVAQALLQPDGSIIGGQMDNCIPLYFDGQLFQFRETIDQVIERQQTRRINGMINKSESKTRILDLCINSITNDENRVTGAVLVFVDKTEQLEMQNLLENKKEDLKKAQQIVLDLLTPREKLILQLIVEGHSTKEIAFDLKISTRTVEYHRYNLMKKLKVPNIPSLIRHAIVEQLVDIEPPDLNDT